MKFIRNGRIRDRFVDFISKALLLAFTVLFCLWMVSGAKAAEITDILQESQSDGGYVVELKFSNPIAKEDINVEYERNFVQVSLKGVNAFPAKTKNLNYSILDKAFTYQYQPDLARARILLKAQASQIKNKSNWELTDSGIKIFFQGGVKAEAVAKKETKKKDAIKVTSSSTSSSASSIEQTTESEDDKIVKQIIQEVKEPTKAAASTSSTATKPESTTASSVAKTGSTEDLPLFGSSTGTEAAVESKGKKSPASKIFAVLLMIIGLIGAGALAFRKFVQGKGVGFQRTNRMIDVVSTQSLGPKKSIAIVKVLDQFMVIGMSGDNINLLANLGANPNIEKQLDDIGPGASFSKTFQSAMSTDSEPSATTITQKSSGNDGIRNLIKKRIEGFKPL